MRQLASKARRQTRGPSSSVERAGRLNFSFALHESAGSPAVSAYIERAGLHADRITTHPRMYWSRDRLIGVQELEAMQPQLVLSATIGLPAELGRIAASTSTQPAVMLADAGTDGRGDALFFRAPARLRLPDFAVLRLVVAAAILRPGETSVDFVCRGPFRWPEERDAALQFLEDVIRSHIAQWMPPVALWDAPADVLLPAGEIV